MPGCIKHLLDNWWFNANVSFLLRDFLSPYVSYTYQFSWPINCLAKQFYSHKQNGVKFLASRNKSDK